MHEGRDRGHANDDLALLARAADAAGPIALRHFQANPTVWEKPDGAGPVSEADLEIDGALRSLLMAARPEYGWLSEETADGPARLDAARVFILDPIDGTRAFLNGDPAFSVALAIAEAGRVMAGIVDMPALALRYTAALGQGAWLNGQRVRASSQLGLSGARALVGKSQLAPELWPKGVPPVTRHFRSGLAWRLCLVAEGQFDAALSLRPAWEWDLAAASLIAAEAGALVTDADGAPLAFNSPGARTPGFIAAPDALHREILALRPERPADGRRAAHTGTPRYHPGGSRRD